MSLSERLDDLFDGEKRMVQKEHRKIEKLIEDANFEGHTICFYAHDSADGWIWEELDYLRLRIWLNSKGYLSLRTEKGINIIWSSSSIMRSLLNQQKEILNELYARETVKVQAEA